MCVVFWFELTAVSLPGDACAGTKDKLSLRLSAQALWAREKNSLRGRALVRAHARCLRIGSAGAAHQRRLRMLATLAGTPPAYAAAQGFGEQESRKGFARSGS
ncbi:MAG: hypothetical protein AAGA76_02555 [Pseudomonadota bacterium]